MRAQSGVAAGGLGTHAWLLEHVAEVRLAPQKFFSTAHVGGAGLAESAVCTQVLVVVRAPTSMDAGSAAGLTALQTWRSLEYSVVAFVVMAVVQAMSV